MSPHPIDQSVIDAQRLLFGTSVAMTVLLLVPGVYIIHKSLKADLKPITVIACLLLGACLNWISIQFCYLQILKRIYNNEPISFDAIPSKIIVLSLSITFTYICYNVSQLIFAVKYWGLSIKLTQVFEHREIKELAFWQKLIIWFMYFLNFTTAIMIGLCDFFFLATENIDRKLPATLRSYAYTCINFLWWGDAILIILAIVRIKKYSA